MKKILRVAIFSTILFVVGCGDHQSANNLNTSALGVLADPNILPFTQAINKNPNDASTFFKRGQALRTLKQDSLALLDFYKATELDSTHSRYFSAIGEVLFEHKDVEGSVKWFRKAIEKDPADPTAHLKFARMLLFVNDNNKAFKEINSVLRRDPYNAEAYFLKGMVYKNMNDTAKSISSFQTSVQVDPGYQPALLQLAMIYAMQKNPLAPKYFDNAYAADTNQMVALHGKAMFFQDNNQIDLAKNVYYTILKKDSNYTDALFNLAWILMQQDSLSKSELLWDRLVNKESDYAEGYYNRAVCKEIQGKKAEALTDYEQVLKLEPTSENAQKAIARLKK